MDKIRAAILGMGGMGWAHLNELRRFDDVEIAALCSLHPEHAARYNEVNGTSYPVYGNFDQMLDEQSIDALFVCLAPHAHSGQIERAAAKGIHIFTEKPLALTVERGEHIADAVAKSGVHSQVGYHMRFGKAVHRVRELMDSGVAGRPTLFSANYECNSLHSAWWRDRTKSGGQIFEQIIHLYDMAYYMLGDVDRAAGFVSNLCHRSIPDYTVEDTSAVSLRFKSGALGSITGSNNAIPNRWAGVFRIVFENLFVEFADHNHCRIVFTKQDNREEIVSGEDSSRTDEDRYFIDTLRGLHAPFATIAEGLAGLKIVSAACRSSEHGGLPIAIDD